MTPYHDAGGITVHHGDALDVLRELGDASVDAVVTDPPYGLEFMGKEWDKFDGSALWTKKGEQGQQGRIDGQGGMDTFGDRPQYKAGLPFQAWCQLWAAECLRVLKPGGHLLAFGGTRTSHRLACAIEDAGFEIRDSVVWLYGSGFPKSLDVSKAIDRARNDRADVLAVTSRLADLAAAADITRADIDAHMGTSDMGGWWLSRIPHRSACPSVDNWTRLREFIPAAAELDAEVWRLNGRKGTPGEAWDQRPITQAEVRPLVSGECISFDQRSSTERERRDIPATGDARTWQGWGTALKPGHEPIVVARKPLAGTVAQTVLAWGTGALNVDGCRVGDEVIAAHGGGISGDRVYGGGEGIPAITAGSNPHTGRWPANVVLSHSATCTDTACVDGCPVREVDAQSGERPGFSSQRFVGGTAGRAEGWGNIGAERGEVREGYGDSGGASRFFYTAKADANERVRVPKPGAESFGAGIHNNRCAKCGRTDLSGTPCICPEPEWIPRSGGGSIAHPTVKPLALMRWLVRLVTPPGGLILDPFAGSGTTLEAALLEGFRCIGIEREAEYLPLIMQRINRRRDPVAYVKAAGGDGGLFDLLGESPS